MGASHLGKAVGCLPGVPVCLRGADYHPVAFRIQGHIGKAHPAESPGKRSAELRFRSPGKRELPDAAFDPVSGILKVQRHRQEAVGKIVVCTGGLIPE